MKINHNDWDSFDDEDFELEEERGPRKFKNKSIFKRKNTAIRNQRKAKQKMIENQEKEYK